MSAERHVRIFKNGRSRAVRIPKEFEFPGDEAIISKDGDRLIIRPIEDRAARLRALLARWRKEPPLGPEDEFPEIDDPPPGPMSHFDD
jgi:antitoxin VapB